MCTEQAVSNENVLTRKLNYFHSQRASYVIFSTDYSLISIQVTSMSNKVTDIDFLKSLTDYFSIQLTKLKLIIISYFNHMLY